MKKKSLVTFIATLTLIVVALTAFVACKKNNEEATLYTVLSKMSK